MELTTGMVPPLQAKVHCRDNCGMCIVGIPTRDFTTAHYRKETMERGCVV